MTLFSLKNNVAIVTGGNRGLGRTFALALARYGADVVVIGRDANKNEAVVKEIEALGRKSLGISVDLQDLTKIQEMVDQVVQTFGKIDILVNNAGVAVPSFAIDVTEEQWDLTQNINLKSVFFCSQAVAKVMKDNGGGRIINIASVLGQVAEAMNAAYAISKGGVIQLTRSLALEWDRFNIRVNAIGPGYFETEMNEAAFKNPKYLEQTKAKTVVNRLGNLEELEGALLLLASEANSYMTGQTLFVDGGWLTK